MPPAAMQSPKLIDTHIHLWPSTATSPGSHTWMTPGHFLATRHSIAEYKRAISAARIKPSGFIYVETDRHLPSLEPGIRATDGDEVIEQKLRAWAQAPLEELRFLRRIVEGAPMDDGADGFEAADSDLLKGMVIFAPFHLPPPLFQKYLHLARTMLGPRAWSLVVGFRYLLQGRGVDSVRKLVSSEAFVTNLRGIEGKVFDVGVDCHRDGVGVLEAAGELVERVENAEGGVRPGFVLNHLCKPDLSSSSALFAWSAALTPLSTHPNVSMKLSGAFNEFEPAATPASVPELVKALTPYFDRVFEAFGPERLMFGSDWPVCNVGGPRGRVDKGAREGESNWGVWREVVEAWMEGRGFEEEVRKEVWWRAGERAYGLDERCETTDEDMPQSILPLA